MKILTLAQLEVQAINHALAVFKGNVTETAIALGIGRATLYRKAKVLNIDPDQFRTGVVLKTQFIPKPISSLANQSLPSGV